MSGSFGEFGVEADEASLVAFETGDIGRIVSGGDKVLSWTKGTVNLVRTVLDGKRIVAFELLVPCSRRLVWHVTAGLDWTRPRTMDGMIPFYCR